ncbi:hypothetical protein LOC67_06330 [Stieleria sp. JC731]|uniref:hypothetical protein n=1 Tax=Pirellulaceae TaxID=2691357 RepID=UPI001E486B37|nr:hypothetical protein [Stieleria sp. JC731]MCC9600170.1 hypothetical protein [Stieleria sp. JC731]
MIRIARVFAVIASITTMTAMARPASAGHDSPLLCAAESYRDAVKDFERVVLREDFVQRCDERLVDDLEDSTSRLRSAAHDLRNADRLITRYSETKILHFQVQSIFFERRQYPYCPRLDASWQLVSLRFNELHREMKQYQAAVHFPGGAHEEVCHTSSFDPRHAAPSHHGGISIELSRPALSPANYQFQNHSSRSHADRGRVVNGSSFGGHGSIGHDGRGNQLRSQYSFEHRSPADLSASRRFDNPVGADIQRHHDSKHYTSKKLSTGDELRRAIVGAILQRM